MLRSLVSVFVGTLDYKEQLLQVNIWNSKGRESSEVEMLSYVRCKNLEGECYGGGDSGSVGAAGMRRKDRSVYLGFVTSE